MEMSDEKEANRGEVNMGYGVETDWWSTEHWGHDLRDDGIAPFFARGIRSTYLKIMDFRTSLKFKMNLPVSSELRDLLIQYVRTTSQCLDPV